MSTLLHYLEEKRALPLVVIMLIALFSALYVDFPLFIPLFGLGSCSGGGSSGSDSAASGDGGDNCAPDNTSDCTNSNCGPGCSSTPFLCVWDGIKFVLENDVLINGDSFFETYAQGINAYMPGTAKTRDCYMLKSVQPKDGTIAFQIKEIEPEESFIDSVTLSQIAIPAGHMLMQNNNHDGFHIFPKDDVVSQRGITHARAHVLGHDSKEIATSDQEHAEEQFIEEGESVIFRAHVDITHESEQPVLVVMSRYRDWVAGEIAALEENKRDHYIVSPLQMIRSGVLLSVAAVLWVAQSISGTFSDASKQADDANVLAQSFGFRTVHADAPGGGGGGNSGGGHSLLIAYQSPIDGTYTPLSIVYPRSTKAITDSLIIPREAIAQDGTVCIKITATKRHAISSIAMFVPREIKTEKDVAQNIVPMRHARHHRLNQDVTHDITHTRDGSFLHTVPGDVVDITFESAPNQEQTDMHYHYMLTFDGFYTQLSPDGKKLAGDGWVDKLDSDSRQRLTEMYALGDYRRAGRKPFLVA